MQVFVTQHFRQRLLERKGITMTSDEERDMLRRMRLDLIKLPPHPKLEKKGVEFDVKVRGVKFVARLGFYKGLEDKMVVATLTHTDPRAGRKKYLKKIKPMLRF